MIQCNRCWRVWPEDYDATHCDCGAPIDESCEELLCRKCGIALHLTDGSEWPEQKLYCWGCAHERLAELGD